LRSEKSILFQYIKDPSPATVYSLIMHRHPQRRSLKTSQIVRLLYIVALLVVVQAATAAADPNTAYGYVKQLLGWKNQAEPVEEENKIPEWSVYGVKTEVKSDFGVDDYSTGATIDTATLTSMDDSVSATGAVDDHRPLPPKDAPPPLPEEVDVDEDISSVVSDLTMDEDEDDFHEAESIADEDEFHDAQEEL
jgi:hypothetical protein